MIFFACETEGLEDDDLSLYEFVLTSLREEGFEVYSPHEDSRLDMEDKEFYQHTMRKVEDCQLFLLYAGIQGFETGMKFWRAHMKEIPILTIVEEEREFTLEVQELSDKVIGFGNLDLLKAQLVTAVRDMLPDS